ncbi:MAG: carbohydrate ABC transporter permease [Lachnospiraceae bacterium]|nr:carbohydrate ABC transporter permease [Lachnospiraceae bacterium]
MIWTTFFILVTLIAMVPILRVVSMSFSSKEAINAGRVTLLPIGFTTEAYVKALTSGSFIRAFGYSIVLMLGSTAVNLLMTVLAAYPLSKKHLIGGNAIMTLFVLTMYLNPGIIPEYLNVRDFGLIDKVWALIIPGALSAYNMIIMCNSFKGIDSAIYDAAKIDGCSEARTLVSVILPLVYPTLATLGLFYAVGRWNGISDVLYYINSSKYFTVQMVLKQFIESITISVQEGMQSNLVADNVKSASIVISMLPMLIVYPFVQKFFTKGIMIGAVKG